jgi:hypothetical protein
MNKKVIVFDTIFPEGHKELNEKFISFLASKTEIIITNKNNYFSNINPKYGKTVKIPFFISYRTNVFTNIIIYCINSFFGWISILKYRYNKVIFFTFDTVGFFFILPFFTGKRKYLFHHNNTDHLQNKYKKVIFRLYMNKVIHIVFADYIKDYLIKEIGTNPNNICVLTHPLIDNTIAKTDFTSNNLYKTYIGLGFANDEKNIEEILSYENSTHILKNNNIQLILRSQIRELASDNIKIIKGFLSKEDYDTYYNHACGLVILYPPSYIRYSGALLYSLNAKKRVIGSNIPTMKHFTSRYPQNCICFDSVKDLFVKLIDYSDMPFSLDEYDAFLKFHNADKIREEIIDIFTNDGK